MRKHIKNDDGYSFVELIIVIAIIAVLSGLAMITTASIRTSRATAAMNTFDTELAALITRTKAQSKDNAILLKRNAAGTGYEIYYGTSTDGTISTWTQTSTGKEASLDRADIYYDSGSGSALLTTDMIIKIKKSDGSVISGDGVYTFCKSGTSTSVGKVTFNKSSGSHYFGN
ncbi:MAG: prepilin-type N-terminal cleavage/methylation domain-containing protein [Coprococcus sp.]